MVSNMHPDENIHMDGDDYPREEDDFMDGDDYPLEENDAMDGNEDARSDADTEIAEVATLRNSSPIPDPDPSPPPSFPSHLPPREETERQYLYEQAHQEYRDPHVRKTICTDRFNAHWLQHDERRPRRRRLRDFQVIRTLGKGFQAKVVAVRTQPSTGRAAHELDYPADFAVKIFNKHRDRTEDGIAAMYPNIADVPAREERTDYEPRVLGRLPWSPWIAGLVDTFVDTRNLYLFTELAHCGTLVDLLAQCAPLRAPDAQFFFANIVAALEFIHKCGIVHGDVKTANFFVGANGYLILGDFGHAREDDNDDEQWFGTGSTCYQPPECLGDRPPERAHRRSVDWWGAACILFEMGAHQLAFAPIKRTALLRRGDDDIEAEVLGRIRKGTLVWPTDPERPIDPYLKDLVERMLIPDPCRRYGMTLLSSPLPTRAAPLSRSKKEPKKPDPTRWENSDIRKHAFMAHFPWNALKHQEVLAPFVPEIKPDLSKKWQTSPLPEQREVPFIPVRRVAAHLKYDGRFEPENESPEDAQRPAKRRRVGKKRKEPLKEYIREVERDIENSLATRRAIEASRPNLQRKVAAALNRELGTGVVKAIQADPPHEEGGAVEGEPENGPPPNVLEPASQTQAADRNENHRPPSSGGWRDFRPDPSGTQPSFEGPFGAIPDASGRGTGPHRRPLGVLLEPHPVFGEGSPAAAEPEPEPSFDNIPGLSLHNAPVSFEHPAPVAGPSYRPEPDPMSNEEWSELYEDRWGENPPFAMNDVPGPSSSTRPQVSGRSTAAVAREDGRQPAAVPGPLSGQEGGRIPAPAWDDVRSSPEESDPVPGLSSRPAASRRPATESSERRAAGATSSSHPEASKVSVEDTRQPLGRVAHASPPSPARSPTGPRRPRRGHSQPGDTHSPGRPSPKRKNLKRKAPHDE